MHCGVPSTCQDKASSNSEKSKPIALAVIKLCLSEGIRKAGSRKFQIKKKLNNLLEAFRVVLKGLLGLAIPNQYFQGARMVLCA